MSNKKTFPFCIIDGTVLTNGLRVLVEGIDTAQFERNPVAFYLHDDWSMPIGTWENIRKEDGRLMADFAPDYADPDVEVQRIIGKVERGIIKMASAGLVELVASDDEAFRVDKQSGPTIVKCRLREASIVPIGKNHNALRLYDRNGIELNLSDKALNLSDRIFFQQPKTKETMNKETMNSSLLKVLNLSDTSTDEQILEAVKLLLSDKQAAEAKVKELQGKWDAHDAEVKRVQKEQAVQLTDAAIRDGRIDANVKDSFIAAFDRDFDGTKTILEGIAKPAGSVKAAINAGKKALELSDKTWDELDREGKLADLKANDFALYSEKFEEKFGKKPNE